ncbi:MAG: MaoC/PaaZ C-terminal domain-containing protein [Porticoccaceae bacterium]
MNNTQSGKIAVGTLIDKVTLPAIDHTALMNYAKASGDYAPVHLDTDYARSMGFPDVIAHGLLTMAYLGRAVTSWSSTRQLRNFSCRFVDVVHLGDILMCSGHVTAVNHSDGEQFAELDLLVTDQNDQVKLTGKATVALSGG